MPVDLALSTGWNSSKHADAMGMVEEILALGIDHLEAGYALRQKQLNGLLELLPQGRFRVSSIHNFCPTPSDHRCAWGDDFLLSSPDEEKRKCGVGTTLETLEWAKRLGARVVVMHLGQVEMDRTTCKAIKQRVADENVAARALAPLVTEVKQVRAGLAQPHLAAVKRSLDDILAALPPGIVLGLENRSDYYQIPNLAELCALVEEYATVVGYWHDVGHAYMQERMGFYEPGEYLQTLHDKLIGLHIHDSLGVSDHRAPGFGEIDFESSVKPYLRKKGVLKVLELHSRVTRAEAVQGIEFLRTRGMISSGGVYERA